MPDIKQLPPHLADLIAAGEVVERPASVVKELVENAIDAGAGAVTVEIAHGGMTLIRVTDNGCGIAAAQAPTAFLRHATSKISDERDLEAIGTLGFRGEALAAISAVSQVELLTKTAGETLGTRLLLEAGEVKDQEEAGCPNGTTIAVRSLFFNTPARLKFVKKDAAEGAAVFACVQRMALSHPELAVKFLRDGRQDLSTPGDGQLKSAVYAVLGRDLALGFTEVRGSGEDMSVSGFASLPACCRGSRSCQHFFVNGRYVRSKLMTAALEEAYKNQKMVGRFPGCVLHLTVKPGSVDVNVHPAKTEVKFRSEQQVFSTVYHGVLSALNGNHARPQAVFATPKRQDAAASGASDAALHDSAPAYAAPARPQASGTGGDTPAWKPAPTYRPAPRGAVSSRPAPRAQGAAQAASPFRRVSPLPPLSPERRVPSGAASRPPVFAPPQAETVPPESAPAKPEPSQAGPLQAAPPQTEAAQTGPAQAGLSQAGPPQAVSQPAPPQAAEPPEGGEWSLRGELFNTYVVVEQGDKVVLIDKHAAHERVNFDRLKASDYQPMVQELLTPLVFTPAPEERETLLEQLELLARFGFEVEEFGVSALAVRAAPDYLEAGAVEDALLELARRLSLADPADPAAARDELYHTMACKAAIKGGQKNGQAELLEVARMVMEGGVKYCPHGRPVAIELTRKQLEKQFKRT